MRNTSDHMKAAWQARVKAGDRRPTCRATIQWAHLRKTPYNTRDAPGGDYDNERDRKGWFTTYLFGQDAGIREIRNIKRCTWSRSTDQDIAECTLTLLNTDIVPIGSLDETTGEDFELPGLFTFSRGDETITPNRWDHGEDRGWNYIMSPDRVVKTYEGYGADYDAKPGDDENLEMSGTWVIDDVTYSADGNIVLAMRDLGRLLLDAISMPPIVPWDDYPMAWSRIRTDEVKTRDALGGHWAQPKAKTTSSNNLYVGQGITDKPPYVGSHGGVLGHNSGDALRGGSEDYWLSTGQVSSNDFVWWQERFDAAQSVAGVRIHTKGGPFRVYVSLWRGEDEGFEVGGWIGNKRIPYDFNEDVVGPIDAMADVPYVATFVAEKGESFEHILKRKYQDITKVRLTFTDLRRDGGKNYPWRAGLRNFHIYAGDYDSIHFGTGTVQKAVGNYRDFTDIVKWVCAWAGFWWAESEQENWIRYESGGPKVHYEFLTHDAVLPKGRVWGSFQPTGTGGIADLTADNFDKQPLLDCITNVRDITGFSFWIDECGGPVWRMPNLYALGNYVTPNHKHPRRSPTRSDPDDIVIIDEETTLLEYSTVLSSKNLRERIFVTDTSGKYGTVIKGYTPYSTGLRRIAGWSDEHFESNREARVAADMIAARQMFDWRRGKIQIWGNPAIQIDDQVRIFERMTNETYYHYVLGISSDLDCDQGTWTYDMETHWLGERPSDAWVVQVDQLDEATQAYLGLFGEVD